MLVNLLGGVSARKVG